MTVLDRFLDYVSIESTAGDVKDNACSDPKMLVLAEKLLAELQALKPAEISINQFGIVDAKFPGVGPKAEIAFLSHMDTSPQASDHDVKVTITPYQGGEIVLHPGMVLSPKEFPFLSRAVGHHVIHTDGNTLLGGDDKAGIAIIMTALSEILANNIAHRPLEIIFTTDEEIGADAEHVSMELVKSLYGYTVDGGPDALISTETFTAFSMDVSVTGKSIHPGSAKDKMVNASNVLMHFQNALPEFLRPEDTDDKEPFFHLCSMKGTEEKASANYIIRSFDENQIQELISLAKLTARRLNDHLGYEAIKLDIKNQYHNMKVVMDKHPEIQAEVEGVYKDLKKPYQYLAVRGGTTGSQLAFMGLPCPNLGTGDYNCHGPYEYVDQEEMEAMVEVVKRLMLA
ncbi:MAG: peptidase T [Bacilli bacterium]|jgi:tripeptide aminopeptidase|nr:peptidase T [Bacilli bacterium]